VAETLHADACAPREAGQASRFRLSAQIARGNRD
jgi:hypothetical protein